MDIDESREKPSKKEIGFLVFFPVEEKCMLSKLNYFKRREERNVYKNRFVRFCEIEKEYLRVEKTRE